MVGPHKWLAMSEWESLRKLLQNLLIKAGFQVAVRCDLAQVPELLGGLLQRCFQFGCSLLAPQADCLSSKLHRNFFDGIIRFHVSHVYSNCPMFGGSDWHSNQALRAGQTMSVQRAPRTTCCYNPAC